MRFIHNFLNISIKDIIEDRYYSKVGQYINKLQYITIVTGPNVKRHLDNIYKYLNVSIIRICEINVPILCDIQNQVKDISNVKVVSQSIENYGSRFVDCDLTCISDIKVIQNTLLKQIMVQHKSSDYKAFIFTIGLRKNNKSKEVLLTSVLGLLGGQVLRATVSNKNEIVNGQHDYLKRINLKFKNKSNRIEYVEAYSYNAGGGPMLTCLIIYK